MRIRLIVDGETLPAVLEDNPAGRDFLSMLPLTLTVKDYNGTEKNRQPTARDFHGRHAGQH